MAGTAASDAPLGEADTMINGRTSDDRHGEGSCSLATRLAKWLAWDKCQRHFWMAVGVGLFALVYCLPSFPAAVDPNGEEFVLSRKNDMTIVRSIVPFDLLDMSRKLERMGSPA